MNMKQCEIYVSGQPKCRVLFRSCTSVLLHCVWQYVPTFGNNVLLTSSSLLNLVLVKAAAIQEVKHFGLLRNIAIIDTLLSLSLYHKHKTIVTLKMKTAHYSETSKLTDYYA